jgi:hypothetical protein
VLITLTQGGGSVLGTGEGGGPAFDIMVPWANQAGWDWVIEHAGEGSACPGEVTAKKGGDPEPDDSIGINVREMVVTYLTC